LRLLHTKHTVHFVGDPPGFVTVIEAIPLAMFGTATWSVSESVYVVAAAVPLTVTVVPD